MEFGGVFGVHENRVARRAGERIDLGVDQRVELFAAPRADFKLVGRAVEVRAATRR